MVEPDLGRVDMLLAPAALAVESSARQIISLMALHVASSKQKGAPTEDDSV